MTTATPSEPSALVEARVPAEFARSLAALADASGSTRSEIVRLLLVRSLRDMATGDPVH